MSNLQFSLSQTRACRAQQSKTGTGVGSSIGVGGAQSPILRSPKRTNAIALPSAAVQSAATSSKFPRGNIAGRRPRAAVAAAAGPLFELSNTTGHGCVAAVVVLSALLHNFYMSFSVGMARKTYNVPYPAMYATQDTAEGRTFNCVQRGHQNCLENLPTFYAALLTASVRYPLTAAAAGLLYLVGKFFYFRGYSTGDPNKRLQGSVSYIGIFTLLGCCVKTAIDTIRIGSGI